mmetsp:Transcript_38204/g.122861  ORF Transcript_38204/g.122861 Transcript_38204/m.122861 type:complete len:249 (-) Transcript_38204:136-882(-)
MLISEPAVSLFSRLCSNGPSGNSQRAAASTEPSTSTPSTCSRCELVRARDNSPLRPLAPQSCGTRPTCVTPPLMRSWHGYNARSNSPPQTKARGAERSTRGDKPLLKRTTWTVRSSGPHPSGSSSGTRDSAPSLRNSTICSRVQARGTAQARRTRSRCLNKSNLLLCLETSGRKSYSTTTGRGHRNLWLLRRRTRKSPPCRRDRRRRFAAVASPQTANTWALLLSAKPAWRWQLDFGSFTLHGCEYNL